jgi:hypothetical protein
LLAFAGWAIKHAAVIESMVGIAAIAGHAGALGREGPFEQGVGQGRRSSYILVTAEQANTLLDSGHCGRLPAPAVLPIN